LAGKSHNRRPVGRRPPSAARGGFELIQELGFQTGCRHSIKKSRIHVSSIGPDRRRPVALGLNPPTPFGPSARLAIARHRRRMDGGPCCAIAITPSIIRLGPLQRELGRRRARRLFGATRSGEGDLPTAPISSTETRPGDRQKTTAGGKNRRHRSAQRFHRFTAGTPASCFGRPLRPANRLWQDNPLPRLFPANRPPGSSADFRSPSGKPVLVVTDMAGVSYAPRSVPALVRLRLR